MVVAQEGILNIGEIGVKNNPGGNDEEGIYMLPEKDEDYGVTS